VKISQNVLGGSYFFDSHCSYTQLRSMHSSVLPLSSRTRLLDAEQAGKRSVPAPAGLMAAGPVGGSGRAASDGIGMPRMLPIVYPAAGVDAELMRAAVGDGDRLHGVCDACC